MKKEQLSRLPKRLYVSGKTIHILYPGLPLKGLPMEDGLYDTVSAFDLARELGLHLKNVPSVDTLMEKSKSPRSRSKSGVLFPSNDMFLVGNKEYFSIRITSQRTGYSPDELRELTLLPDSGILFVAQKQDNDKDAVLFFDVESVKTYRPKKE